MGVKKLWTLVTDQRKNLINPILLNEIDKLLIDGNNLSYNLFYNLPDELMKVKLYGGDYAHYKKFINNFFDKLANFNVEPIVLFDGAGKSFEECKIKFQKRLKDAIRVCDPTNYAGNDVFCGWPSASTVLFEVLRERDICHRQCIGNADDVIPVIARHYNCPVLSNDSDYLLLDLPAGVIQMKTFMKDFLSQPVQFDSAYSVQVYTFYDQCHENIKQNNLQPLVGPLLGNHQVNQQIHVLFVKKLQQDLINDLNDFLGTIESYSNQFYNFFPNNSRFKRMVDSFCEDIKKTLFNIHMQKCFALLSQEELGNVAKRFAQELEGVQSQFRLKQLHVSNRDFTAKLYGIGERFAEVNKQFGSTCDYFTKMKWFYIYIPQIVCQWLSVQKSHKQAIKKLKIFCVDIKHENKSYIVYNNNHPKLKSSDILSDNDFDEFVRKLETPPEPFYLKFTQLTALSKDLPVNQFLDELKDKLFPAVPGIPAVLHRGLISGAINPRLLSILNGVDMCPVMLENYNTKICSNECTRDLDREIYKLISEICSSASQNGVTRIYREGDKMKTVKFESESSSPNLTSGNFSKMTEIEREMLFNKIVKAACFTQEVNIELLKKLIDEVVPDVSNRFPLLVMILSLIMSAQKCSIPDEKEESSPSNNLDISFMEKLWQSILANILFLGYIGTIESKTAKMFKLDKKEIKFLLNELKQFDHLPEEESKFNIWITHYFNSHNSCMQSMNFLLQVLNLHETCGGDRFVCGLQGSFVHNLTEHLKSEKGGGKSLDVIFGKKQFDNLSQINLKLLPVVMGYLQTSAGTGKKAPKRSLSLEEETAVADQSSKRSKSSSR